MFASHVRSGHGAGATLERKRHRRKRLADPAPGERQSVRAPRSRPVEVQGVVVTNGEKQPASHTSEHQNGNGNHKPVQRSATAPVLGGVSRVELEIMLDQRIAALKDELRAELREELLRGADNKGSAAPARPPVYMQGEAAEAAAAAERRAGALEQRRIFSEASEEDFEEVELQSSIWDTVLLLGTAPCGLAGSMFGFLLVLGNSVGQGLFVYIVANTDLSEKNYDDDSVDAFKMWRRTVAHDVQYYNPITHESLATRVCNGDAGLEMSGAQAASFEEVSQYLQGDILGMLMAIFAMGMWFLTVSKELTTIYTHARAYSGITRPRGWGRGTELEPTPNGGLRLKSISRPRLLFCMTVMLLRTVIACTLGYYGGLYLSYTISLSDLLLNAVALEFVINIDELFYEVLCPQSIKRLVVRMEAFKLEAPSAWKGLDAQAPLKTIVTLGMMWFFVRTELMPQKQVLDDVFTALCGGEQGVLFTIDGLGSPVWSFEDQNPGDGSTFNRDHVWPRQEEQAGYTLKGLSFAESVVDFVLQGKYYDDCPYLESCVSQFTGNPTDPDDQPGCCLAYQTKAPSLNGDRLSVLAKSKEGLIESTAVWNPQCLDQLDVSIGAMNRNILVGSLIDAVSLVGVNCNDDPNLVEGNCPSSRPFCNPYGVCVEATCEAVTPFCNSTTIAGVRARQLCPIQCGCEELRSTLALSTPLTGCPHTCGSSITARHEISSMPCEDVAKNDTNWLGFVDQMLYAAQSWPIAIAYTATMVGLHLREWGCEYLTMHDYPTDYYEKYEAQMAWYNALYPGTPVGEQLVSPSQFISVYTIGFNSNYCVSGGTSFPIQPLSGFCPQACGCRRGDVQCPFTCPDPPATQPSLTGEGPPSHFLDEAAWHAYNDVTSPWHASITKMGSSGSER